MGLKHGESENSIQRGYVKLISEAKHLIYIENQFFISGNGDPREKHVISNQIANALVTRITQAIVEDEDFRVVIVLPLLPGFTGDINDKSSKILRIQLGWLYQTINRGDQSIIERYLISNTSRLKNVKRKYPTNTKQISDYIKFMGMRNHGCPKGDKAIPVTEIIYIHSKVACQF